MNFIKTLIIIFPFRSLTTMPPFAKFECSNVEIVAISPCKVSDFYFNSKKTHKKSGVLSSFFESLALFYSFSPFDRGTLRYFIAVIL